MDVEGHLQTFVLSHYNETEHSIAFDEIKQFCHVDKKAVDTIVSSLGKFLTSDDKSERNRATLVIAELIYLDCLTLSDKSFIFLARFFCGRLADYPSIVPSLHALRGLIKCYPCHVNSFAKSDGAMGIFNALSKELDVQSLSQAIRQRVSYIVASYYC